jgi:hypothetical protein
MIDKEPLMNKMLIFRGVTSEGLFEHYKKAAEEQGFTTEILAKAGAWIPIEHQAVTVREVSGDSYETLPRIIYKIVNFGHLAFEVVSDPELAVNHEAFWERAMQLIEPTLPRFIKT